MPPCRAVDADANSPSCASILLYIPLHHLEPNEHEQRVSSVQLNVNKGLIQFRFMWTDSIEPFIWIPFMAALDLFRKVCPLNVSKEPNDLINQWFLVTWLDLTWSRGPDDLTLSLISQWPPLIFSCSFTRSSRNALGQVWGSRMEKFLHKTSFKPLISVVFIR